MSRFKVGFTPSHITFITSNQLRLIERLDSFIFYLVKGVKVATIKSVWKI